MADEFVTPSVTGVTDALGGDHTPYERQRHREPHREGEGGGHDAEFDFHDTTSIHGIPEEELTPAVQAALADFMAEIDRLRGETARQKERIEWLEREAEHHPILPVLNRRGLMHALNRVLPRIESGHVHVSLVCLHIAGIERLRLRHGLPASDEALRQVADILNDGRRETDLVASLGAYDFCVLLPLADEDAARAVGQELARRIADTTIRWEDGVYQLSATFGAAEVMAGAQPEQVVGEAAPVPGRE